MLAMVLVFFKQIFDLNAKRRGKIVKYEKVGTALPTFPFGNCLNWNKAFFRHVLLLQIGVVAKLWKPLPKTFYIDHDCVSFLSLVSNIISIML